MFPTGTIYTPCTLRQRGLFYFCRSVLMMLAPKRVEAHEAETAGSIMVLFLVSGLAGGALSGWLWLL